MATLARTLAQTRQALQGVSDAPDLDATWLLLHVLGQRETSWLALNSHHELDGAQSEHLAALLARRRGGEPLAYILGQWEFYGRPFTVTPDVLIPRPATEALIDAVLEYMARLSSSPLPDTGKTPGVFADPTPGVKEVSGSHPKHPFTIADVGTGSGCIAITLALELAHYPLSASTADPPIWRAPYNLIATDLSPSALAVAAGNAKRHGVAGRITFRHGDMLAPLHDTPVDLIVSNPPYVPSAEFGRRRLSPTPDTAGLSHEPRRALDGGNSGQDFIKKIIASRVPAIIETTGGNIKLFNINIT